MRRIIAIPFVMSVFLTACSGEQADMALVKSSTEMCARFGVNDLPLADAFSIRTNAPTWRPLPSPDRENASVVEVAWVQEDKPRQMQFLVITGNNGKKSLGWDNASLIASGEPRSTLSKMAMGEAICLGKPGQFAREIDEIARLLKDAIKIAYPHRTVVAIAVSEAMQLEELPTENGQFGLAPAEEYSGGLAQYVKLRDNGVVEFRLSDAPQLGPARSGLIQFVPTPRPDGRGLNWTIQCSFETALCPTSN